MTPIDILSCTPRFWEFHLDPIGATDVATFTLITIQINLAAGTLAPFAENQPQYRKLLDQMLKFEISLV